MPRNLIWFELKGLDVVLGMDWWEEDKARIENNEKNFLTLLSTISPFRGMILFKDLIIVLLEPECSKPSS